MSLTHEDLDNLERIALSRSPGRYQGVFNYLIPEVTLELIALARRGLDTPEADVVSSRP